MTISDWVRPVDAGRFSFGSGPTRSGATATSPDGRQVFIGGPLPPGWTDGWKRATAEEWEVGARIQQAKIWGP